jgi:hypothetical protein
LNPSWSNRLFSSLKGPECLWVPQSLIFNGYRDSFPECKIRVVMSTDLHHASRSRQQSVAIQVFDICTEYVKVKVSRNRTEGPEWSGGKALLFLDFSSRRGGWSAPRPGRFTPGKDQDPLVHEAVFAPGPLWTCAKNIASTGIRSPDRPAHSQSLYQMSYPGPLYDPYKDTFILT